MAGASATSSTRTVRVAGTSEVATSSSRGGPEPFAGEHAGEDAVGEPAQAGERVAHPRLRAGQSHAGRWIGPGEGDAQVEGDADQALLGAVVQVAFDAPAFGVRGGDHPLLGGSDLGQPGAGDGG
jgi:hypothetical protein